MTFIVNGLGETARINFMWLVGCAFIYTIGELYLSPIGLSLVTKVAPARLVSMLMGMWFLSNFFGNYLAGYLGTFYEKMSHESFFLMLMALGVAAGLAILSLGKPLRKAVGHNTKNRRLLLLNEVAGDELDRLPRGAAHMFRF